MPGVVGDLTLMLCHPSGEMESPTVRTVFRRGRGFAAFDDVEIRGYLDGQVKFERNVATQYHVRVGCEGSKPVQGRYEVMRVLQRWDVSTLPADARVSSVRVLLYQEDCSRFPYRYPLRWPVDFYLYEVRKPWGVGRGGVSRDNLSRPERGDAWWVEAQAGEAPWREPGCGHGSDVDPEADRSAEPLAWARIEGADDDLCFTGDRLAAYVERALRQGGLLSVLIKASAVDETLPGSIKTFFSGEFGDELNPERRPRLEVEWSARCLAVERRPFVLEPGAETVWSPALPKSQADIILAASLDTREAPDGFPVGPAVRVEGWVPSPGVLPAAPPPSLPLDLPLRGSPGEDVRIRLRAAPNPVVAGTSAELCILETWTPDVASPDDLVVSFRFTAPSLRTFHRPATHQGGHAYAVTFRPDEPGIWSYEWHTRPDRRFEEQRGGGLLSVIPGDDPSYLAFLRRGVEDAGREASFKGRLLGRRRTHFRLVTLQRELRALLTRDIARDTASPAAVEVRGLLKKVAELLPLVE